MTSETEADLPDVKLADVQQELEPLVGMSVWARMRLSYLDMRRTTRALIDENPAESRLLVFVLLSDIVFFLARGLQLVVSPTQAAEASVPFKIGMWLIAALLLRTMTMYIFSAVVKIVGNIFGGEATWKETRTAVFWASLVAAPAGVLGSLIGAGFAHLEAVYPIVASPYFAWPPLLLGPVCFIWFISMAVAEAHRFDRSFPVLVAFCLLAVVLATTAFVFGSQLSGLLEIVE